MMIIIMQVRGQKCISPALSDEITCARACVVTLNEYEIIIKVITYGLARVKRVYS